jgi:hypothetical protein
VVRRRSSRTSAFFVPPAASRDGFDFRLAAFRFSIFLAVAFAALVATFAVLTFFPARFVFGVSCCVVPEFSLMAISVFIVISSFLAVDPRVTIHHSGSPGKRAKDQSRDRSCLAW